ncbi:MAG: hypothetical protein NVSMB28_26710 [Collimonas sp.]
MLELQDVATREHIDVATTFAVYEQALGRGCKVPGGMYWHKVSLARDDHCPFGYHSAAAQNINLQKRINIGTINVWSRQLLMSDSTKPKQEQNLCVIG